VTRLSLTLLEPEDVIRHLGKGKMHWKAGRSAHALATRWHEARDIPAIVRATLDRSAKFTDAKFVDGFLERSVALPDGGRATQTDLMAILHLRDGLAVAAVEGKVDETFGPLVGEWLTENPARAGRLTMLCAMFGLRGCDDNLRYQLFHRSASALLEADRYRADTALLLVHSFSPENAGFADFAAFLRAMGIATAPVVGEIYGPLQCRIAGRDIGFFAGWIADDCADVAEESNFWQRLRMHARDTRAYADDLLDWADQRAR
jgi:hypothetical protein